MKTYLFKVLDDFEQHLANLSLEASTPLKCYEKSVLYAIQVLTDLKIEIVKHDFIDKYDEINFFKNIKPQLTSKLIYLNALYKMEPETSALSTNKKQEFYKRELLKLQMFFEDNKDFYTYYKMKHSHLDKFYFRRGKHNIRLNLDAYLINSDLLFTTSHDFILAQIIANEALKLHFESQILPEEESEELSEEIIGNSGLIWTASQRDLVEIIHAFHGAGVFNYGRVTLKFITKVFEQMFGFSAGDIYKGLDDIGTRKGEPTYFLNRLKVVILTKLGW